MNLSEERVESCMFVLFLVTYIHTLYFCMQHLEVNLKWCKFSIQEGFVWHNLTCKNSFVISQIPHNFITCHIVLCPLLEISCGVTKHLKILTWIFWQCSKPHDSFLSIVLQGNIKPFEVDFHSCSYWSFHYFNLSYSLY